MFVTVVTTSAEFHHQTNQHVVHSELPNGDGSEFIVAASVAAAVRMSVTNSWDADRECEVTHSL